MKSKILVLSSCLLLVLGMFFILGEAPKAEAANAPLAGWAWSSNIGWISFNCNNQNSCSNANYSVNLDTATGLLSGYAWSSNIGWINFNSSGLTGCPSGACEARIVNNKVTGWAKALNGNTTSGWLGWIHLSDPAANPKYTVLLNGQAFEGFSWGEEVVGWMKWNPANGGVTLSGSYLIDVTVTLDGVVKGKEKRFSLFNRANASHGFNSWGGAAASCGHSMFCDLVINSDTYVTADFGPNGGVVESVIPAGIITACKRGHAGDCVQNGLAGGTLVRLRAEICGNNIDDDLDGLIDEDCPVQSACSDGIDNDGDGLIDYGTAASNDPGCSSPTDSDEGPRLTVAVSGGGSVSATSPTNPAPNPPAIANCVSGGGVNICTEHYNSGTTVTLTATVPAGQRVTWTNCTSGANNTCSTTMGSTKTVTATFSAVSACSDGVDNDGDGLIDFGTAATNDPGCSSATDDDEGPRLVVAVTGNSQVRVNSSPAGINNCRQGAGDCVEHFNVNQSVTLTASNVPTGYTVNWTNCTPSSNPLQCTATMNNSKTVTAAVVPANVCGNGVVEGSEQCDGGNLNGETCTSQGYAGGTLRCTSSCLFDTSLCTPGGPGPGPTQCPTDGADASGNPTGLCPVCWDNIDNDGDGLKDYLQDPSCGGNPFTGTEGSGGEDVEEI